MTAPRPTSQYQAAPARRIGAWGLLWATIPGLLIGAAGAIACYLTLGPSLGLFFGGLLMGAMLVPPLVLAEEGLAGPLVAGGATCAGIVAVWVWAALRSHGPVQPYPTLGDCAKCAAVLVAFAAALAGASLLLRQVRVSRPLAASGVVLLATAWLCWPVWLSPWLSGRGTAVAWLVPAHPVLTVNSVVRHLGVWDEQPLAYHLTVLNRDVTYPLPAGIGPAVLVHLGIGLLALVPVAIPVVLRARRLEDTVQHAPDTPTATASPAQ